MHKNNKINHDSGVTLIELMLALSLSLLLLGFVFEIVVTSERYFHLQTALQQNQESALAAIDILKSEIRQAGHIGCAKLTPDFPLYSLSHYSITAQNKLVSGSNNTITVRYAEYPSVALVTPVLDGKTLCTNKDIPMKLNDILLISDCKHAELVQIDAALSHCATTRQLLHYQFDHLAELSRFRINTYFVRKTARKDRSGVKVSSLFMSNINGRAMELVEGINHMSLAYTIYRDGRLITLSANEISDWSQIRGVAIDLEVSVFPVKKMWHAYVAL